MGCNARMDGWQDGFIAVDWGTTNRRAYLLDGAGVLLREMEDDLGLTAIEPGGFEPAVAQITAALGDRPMLLGGMIGSNRGWREAPYVPCPAQVEDLAGRVLWVEPGRIGIVPGLSLVEGGRGDVMRGEEVQVFGLLAGRQGTGRLLLCHPGTHTKWITCARGAVTGFRTVMTGELFSLLREHSILGPMLDGTVEPGAAFLRGVEAGRATTTLAADLFGVRASVLLGLMPEADAASFASGLLIGNDLVAGLAMAGGADEVVVLGRPSLTRLYAAALARCGIEAREVDGGVAFVAGMQAVRNIIAGKDTP